MLSFEFAKITCGRSIDAETDYQKYCKGRSLEEVLKIRFSEAIEDLKLTDEERQYVLHLEWAALRSAIAQYLGIENQEYDKDRCQITSIEHTEGGTEVALVILPPKELPKILPCSLASTDEHW